MPNLGFSGNQLYEVVDFADHYHCDKNMDEVFWSSQSTSSTLNMPVGRDSLLFNLFGRSSADRRLGGRLTNTAQKAKAGEVEEDLFDS